MQYGAPRILAVCTGNICRSPAIERVFRSRLGQEALVASAGTGAMIGSPIAPDMSELLDRVNVPTANFQARQLTAPLIDGADLIITATVEHRAKVVDLQPKAMHKTFTLLEFAIPLSVLDLGEIAHLSIEERLEPLADYVKSSRPKMRLTDKQLDVPDPYGHGEDVYITAFTLIYQAVTTITHVLTAK
ncbi:MAG: hypothetical protein LBG99_03645 [Propionibacteriaceae bacterium]|jgi:protein-tyrosine phosphatase|nr:hypothetical protein [Propionibacteriaceae bacterium]